MTQSIWDNEACADAELSEYMAEVSLELLQKAHMMKEAEAGICCDILAGLMGTGLETTTWPQLAMTIIDSGIAKHTEKGPVSVSTSYSPKRQ